MTAAVILLLLFGFGVNAQNSVSVTNCNTASVFQISNLAFDPSNPIPGQNGTLILDYNVPALVSSGSVNYKCNYNGLPVYNEVLDLCSQTACPINVGLHNDKSISPVPNANGKVACTIQWYDIAKTELLCINMILKLQ
jgi:hypothetical protein